MSPSNGLRHCSGVRVQMLFFFLQFLHLFVARGLGFLTVCCALFDRLPFGMSKSVKILDGTPRTKCRYSLANDAHKIMNIFMFTDDVEGQSNVL